MVPRCLSEPDKEEADEWPRPGSASRGRHRCWVWTRTTLQLGVATSRVASGVAATAFASCGPSRATTGEGNVDFRDGDQGIWVEIDIYLAPPRWNEEGGKKSRFKKVGLWILSRERVRNRVQRQPNRGWLSRIDTKSSTGGRGWRARLLAKVGERETRNSECIFG
jgi:hypothetical protein